MTDIRFSVVIPTHETRELVERCLLSLEPERDADVEVVVVDDGSADGTTERMAERFPWARVIRHERARGFTASVNDGLAAARGELLLLLNSDTEVRPGALEALAAAFEADPRLGIAGAALQNPDGSPQWSAGREPSLVWLFGLSSGLGRWVGLHLGRRLRGHPGQAMAGPVDWVTGAAMAIRRDTYRILGPLEVAYRFYVQDMDYCLRAREAGFGVQVVSASRVMHIGGATVSKSDGAVGPSHPGLLMLDLVTWASLRRGRAWARRARLALRLGLGLRVGVRRFLTALQPHRHGTLFRDATASLVAAGRAIRASG